MHSSCPSVRSSSCGAFILILFAMVDIELALSIGPLIAVAIASVWVYKDARRNDR